MQHAHFGSALSLVGTVLEVLLGFTFLRLLFLHAATSGNKIVSGIGRAGLVQTG